MSWISLQDVVSAIVFCLENDNLNGPVNLVAPQPVSNKEFGKTLARVLNRPAFFPVPGFVVKTLFGQMGEDLLLSSTRVSCQKLLDAGFEFAHESLEQAIKHQLVQ